MVMLAKAPPTLPGLRCTIISLLVLAASIPAGAQNHRFINYDMSDGLPSNIVYAITQSASGYMWFGSDAGITRFDGHRFQSFLLDQSISPETLATQPDRQPARLPGASVQYLFSDGDRIFAALESAGLAILDEDLRLLRLLTPYNTPSMPSETIWSMERAGPGQLWIGFSDSGLTLFDRSTQSFTPYHLNDHRDDHRGDHRDDDKPANNSAELPSIYFIFSDDNDAIWVSTMQQDLFYKAASSETFARVMPNHGAAQSTEKWLAPEFVTSITQDADYVYALTRSRLLLLAKSTASMHASILLQDYLDHEPDDFISLKLDRHQRLWLSSRSSLYRMRLNAAADGIEEVLRFQPTPELTDGIKNNAYFNFIDRDDGLWIATMQGGIMHRPSGWDAFTLLEQDPANVGIETQRRVRSLLPAGGQLWIGTDNTGTLRYDLTSNRYTTPASLQVLHEQYPIKSRVSAMTLDTNGRLWLGLKNRIASYTADAGASMSTLAANAATIMPNRLIAGLFDSGHGMWATTNSRYLLNFDAQQSNWQLYDINPYTSNDRDQTLMAHAVLADGSFIIATRKQVLHYQRQCHCMHSWLDSNQKPIQNMLVRGHHLYLVRGDQLELYSITTADNDNPHATLLQHWRMPQDLSQAGIVNILQTDAQTLWLSTARSILRLRLDATTKMPTELRDISRSDGLIDMELEANTMMRLDDGRIAIAGTDGVAIFQPKLLNDDLPEPTVVLQQIRSSRRSLVLPSTAAVNTATKATKTPLPHNENTLFISFQSILFSHREQLQFQYRLLGWEDDWISAGDNLQAIYSNLPHGDYRFQVQARLGSQDWGPVNDHLHWRIQRPPWLSHAAISAYSITALLLLTLAWQRHRQYRHQQQALALAGERQRFARQQSALATRLNRSIQPAQIAQAIHASIHERMPLRRMHINFLSDSKRWYDFPQQPTLHIDPDALYRQLANNDGVQPLTAAAGDQLMDSELDHALLMPLGSKQPCHALAVILPQQAPDQEQLGFLKLAGNMAGSAIDNCELLQQVTQLADTNRRANEAKSEFIAMVSHEIRTPLHGLMGMLHLLDQQANDAQRKITLNQVNHSSEQLLAVLDDVLDISKIEAKKIELRHDLFNLQQLCQQLEDLFLAKVQAKNIYLLCLLAPDLMNWRIGDRDRCLQILTNLVSNAIKFTDSGGIMVCLRNQTGAHEQQQDQVLFAVHDTGIGIRREDQQRLFQRFEQVGEMTWQRYGGSGLGLAISHHLCQSLGGRLSVLSEPGQGSVFRASLPLPIPAALASIEPLPVRTAMTLYIACGQASAPLASLLQGIARVQIVDSGANIGQDDPALIRLLLTTSQTMAKNSPLPTAILHTSNAAAAQQQTIAGEFYLPGQWQQLLAWIMSHQTAASGPSI